MKSVSDGRLYNRDDIVKAGCDGCNGCSECCHGMGSSIVLDPYDIFRMTKHCSCTMNDLLAGGVELNIVDGLILPNLKMSGDKDSCYYLNADGRCSIHHGRPGICRMFPLGRIYEKGAYNYFLQIHECPYDNKSSVRVSDWIDTDNIKKYEKYILVWHELLIRWRKLTANCDTEPEMKQYVMYLIMLFYNKAYDLSEDFYSQFYSRIEEAHKLE